MAVTSLVIENMANGLYDKHELSYLIKQRWNKQKTLNCKSNKHSIMHVEVCAFLYGHDRVSKINTNTNHVPVEWLFINAHSVFKYSTTRVLSRIKRKSYPCNLNKNQLGDS